MKVTTVRKLAAEAGLDVDEALIALWDAGLDGVRTPEDRLPRREANRARRALGLATRRELASGEYWQRKLEMTAAELADFLAERGVTRPFDGGRLRSKAIHRLQSEARARLLDMDDQGTIAARDGAPPEVEFLWETIGHEAELKYLSVEDVLRIHEELVADFANTTDPLEPPGVRSVPLLESAVHRPLTALGDTLKYPTVEMAGAALLHGLIHDHPFHNGNKRTAAVALLVFLDENGLMPVCDDHGLFKIVLQLAQHALVKGVRASLADREVLIVAEWIRRNTRRKEMGDRAIQWRRLRRILTDYGCEFSYPTVGNRINIERRVEGKSRWFGRPKRTTLRTQTHYGDDGREVDKNSVSRIRRELHLDDEHGVDSAAFYDDAATTSSEFIVRYRMTLRRLARL